APRGLREPQAAGRTAARAADRGGVGHGRGQLRGRDGGHRGRSTRPAARHRRCAVAREDQRHRGAHAKPRRAGLHALHVRCRQPRAAEARVRAGARAERRHPRGPRLMDELLSNPAVQAGAAPFLAGLIVAVALRPLKLGGLAVTAAFATTVYFVAGFQFSPLTATRKMILVALVAPAVGILVDFAFKPTRLGAALLVLAAGGAAWWAYAPVLAQRPASEAGLLLASAIVVATFVVGFGQAALASDGVRAGAAALALGAGAGAFLLPQMITGTKSHAGATFVLPAMLTAALVGVGTMTLAKMPWHVLLVLGLVPLAVRLPGPERAPVWLQAVIFSLYGFAVAGLACYLAWP